MLFFFFAFIFYFIFIFLFVVNFVIHWNEKALGKQVYTEALGLMKIDSSTILEPFGSNQFMSCSQAMSSF